MADGGDPLVVTVGQDFGQARSHYGRVFGDHNPHRGLRFGQAWDGSSMVTAVGPPGGLLTRSLPSTVLIRSASPARPPRSSMRAPPQPSSLTRTRSRPGTWAASSVAWRGRRCFVTFGAAA